MDRRAFLKGVLGLGVLASMPRLSWAGKPNPNCQTPSTSYRLEEFGTVPANGDYTGLMAQARDYIAGLPSGGRIQLDAKVYWLPEGFKESAKGLEVVGMGHGEGGTGGVGQYGTVIKVTESDAWGWVHENSNPTFNDGRGPMLRNLSFLMNDQCAGGVWTQAIGTRLDDIRIYNLTKPDAQAILVSPRPGFPTNDASWFKLNDCHLHNCWNGLRLTGADAGCSIKGLTTLNTTAGGIVGQGVGIWTDVGNVRIMASKTERHGIGWYSTADTGVAFIGCNDEGSSTAMKLDRAAYAHASKINVVAFTSTAAQTYLYLGPHQAYDRIDMTKTVGALVDLSGTAIYRQAP